MSISEFISKQIPERQELLASIHQIIIQSDKNVEAVIEPMMGKEMIVYKAHGMFKYGLSSPKSHMSLHVLPIYASPPLYAKYKRLLEKAKFQKGCINFKNEEDVPAEVVKQLMTDCSKIDLAKIREEYMKSRKS